MVGDKYLNKTVIFKNLMIPTTSNGNVPLGKRKKGSYLSKWLDKTMQHIQEPCMDTYDSYINPNNNWPVTPQFAPGYDPYRYNALSCTQEPTSLPTLPTYSSPLAVPPFYTPEYRYTQSVNKSVQVQRPRRRRNSNKIEEGSSTPKQNVLRGHGMLQPKNFVDSQDFASLPPIITSVGDTNSNSDMNINDKDDASNARRFSDPCVRGLPDVAQPANGDVESGSDTGSSTSESQVGNRLLICLLDQISSLKFANERLRKELMDSKMELDNVRQQNIMLQKGQSASMAGTPLGNGMLHGQYSPGFVTDVVREIRDSARLREEAMYSRVRAMVLERTDSGMASSDSKYSDKALEEIKNQPRGRPETLDDNEELKAIVEADPPQTTSEPAAGFGSSLRASELDKRRMMDRIGKLEEELRDLRLTANSTLGNSKEKLTNGNVEDAETERLRLRKELADMRKAKQTADDHALKLERLVTQMRTKFNGVQISSNGSDSLQSDPDHELSIRPRRTSTSANSSTNSTVVFGPVTDL